MGAERYRGRNEEKNEERDEGRNVARGKGRNRTRGEERNVARGEERNVRKIVVFDTGWGGELVADFLMREIVVVEVVRVIDWARRSYGEGRRVDFSATEFTEEQAGLREEEFCEEGGALDLDGVIECLAPYIGEVDVIVLGGYTVGMTARALAQAFPEQKFVAPQINYDKILRMRQYPENVAILMNSSLQGSRLFRELREKLPYSTLILPECMDWERLIDENLMTREVVRTELAWDFETQDEGSGRRRRAMDEASSRTAGGEASRAMDEALSKGTDEELSLAEKLRAGESGSGGGKVTKTASSADKQALLKAIQSFSKAAEEASREEERETAAAARIQEAHLERDANRLQIRPDVVLLLNTHFWEIKEEIEAVLGWKVRVLDFREKLLHDVCAALKLRGVDGRRAK